MINTKVKTIGFLASTIFGLSILCNAQTSDMCIIEQPLPKLPENYGTLDAQASAIYRVEFRADGSLGKISPILSTHISNLDVLSRSAVEKITFKPKIVDGQAVSINKMIQYRYSWEFGWRVAKPKNQIYCPKPKVKQHQRSR